MPDDPLEISLFPLPSVVLFPLATVPLYVFEPRYRQMIAHALDDGPRRIGMVAVDVEHHGEMSGNPPVAAIGCEGEIVAAEKNADGTYRMLLRGTRRFEIVDERLPEGDRLYRRARVETRPELLDQADRDAMRAERRELIGLLSDLVQRTAPRHAGEFDASRFDDVGEAQLVNALAQAIQLDAHDKQQLLEVDRVRDRRHMLCELMRFRIAELDGGGGFGSTTIQ